MMSTCQLLYPEQLDPALNGFRSREKSLHTATDLIVEELHKDLWNINPFVQRFRIPFWLFKGPEVSKLSQKIDQIVQNNVQIGPTNIVNWPKNVQNDPKNVKI